MATPERHKTPEQNKDYDALLDALALAMVKKPKASLGELAKAVGISRGTLYNFCRTRDELLERLFNYGLQVITKDMNDVRLETSPPLEALREMTQESLKHWEITLFMIRYWKPEHGCSAPELDWDTKMDALFLRGQQDGVFRIDIPAASLSEIWVALFVGLVDAEYRGRIARAGMVDLMERAFLQGVAPVREKVFA